MAAPSPGPDGGQLGAGSFGVPTRIRLPSFSWDDDLRLSGGGGSSAGPSDATAPGSIVVAGATTQLGMHFIRLLIESQDFGTILVRGLVPAEPPSSGATSSDSGASRAVEAARAELDSFCGEDTSRRVHLSAIPYFTHGHAAVAVDGTVGSSLDPRLGILGGTLLQAQCLQRAALTKAMAGCLYVLCCWGSELQSAFRSASSAGAGGAESGDAGVVGTEFGSVASLLSEAARQSAAHFVHISAVLGQAAAPEHADADEGDRPGLWRLWSDWWSSWSLSTLLYRSTNEEALVWKERAERLVRRAGAATGCGLPYTIIRLAPLRRRARLERQRAKRGSLGKSAGVGSSASADVVITQFPGRRQAAARARPSDRCYGPIWERPAHRPYLSADEFAGEDAWSEGTAVGGGSGGGMDALDPVDAARVALFCIGNAGTVGTSFEVRGRDTEPEDEARQARGSMTLLSDLLADLIPDRELIEEESPHDEGSASWQAHGPAVRVAPWSRICSARVIVMADRAPASPPSSPTLIAQDDDGERALECRRHPLAREGEWEPFVCYTVQMHKVLLQPNPADDAEGSGCWRVRLAEGADGARWRVVIEREGREAADHKPSGVLQTCFVRFRYSDFARLQEVLEEHVTRPDAGAGAAADADDAAKVEAERTVAELRQLLPARRWLKTETAVVEERRRGLQVYLDRVLQLPPAQSGTLGKVVELWVAAAVQRCSATEQF